MDNYDYFKDENSQDEWVNLSEPVFSAIIDTESEKNEELPTEKKTRNYIIAPVLTFQLVVAILVLISLFIVKSFSPELFFRVQRFYDTQISRSMITDGDFSDIDYQDFFSSSTDEI